MARRPARTTSSAPQGRGAPQRDNPHLDYRTDEANQAPARTEPIVHAWPENGPPTVSTVGAADRSNDDPSNPHAFRGSPAQAELRGVRRAVPLYQGTGANIWGPGFCRVSTTGSHPPATTSPRGLAPNVQGVPPPQEDDKLSAYAGGGKGGGPEVVRTSEADAGELRSAEERRAAATAIQAAWRRYDVHSDYKQIGVDKARLRHILLLASQPGADKDELWRQLLEVKRNVKDRAWRRRGTRAPPREDDKPSALAGEDREESTGDRRSAEVKSARPPGGHAPPVPLLQGEELAGDPQRVDEQTENHQKATQAFEIHTSCFESSGSPRPVLAAEPAAQGERSPPVPPRRGAQTGAYGGTRDKRGIVYPTTGSQGSEAGPPASPVGHAPTVTLQLDGLRPSVGEDAKAVRAFPGIGGEGGRSCGSTPSTPHSPLVCSTVPIHGLHIQGEERMERGRMEAQAATKIQAAWRGYSVHEEYLAAIEECALHYFLGPSCDSDGWSATSDGSSVGSKAEEPLAFDDVNSALAFIETLPAEIRHRVEMVAVDEGRAISGGEATSPPARTGIKAALGAKDEGGVALAATAPHPDPPGIGEEEEGREEESWIRDEEEGGINAAATANRPLADKLVGGLSERRGVRLAAVIQGTPDPGEQTEGLLKGALSAMMPRLVTPDAVATTLWQPEELVRPPTPWEADDNWGWEGSEHCSLQLRVYRERRKGHAKGDVGRRSAALGDIAEEDRVFALRLAGLDGEVGRNSGG